MVVKDTLNQERVRKPLRRREGMGSSIETACHDVRHSCMGGDSCFRSARIGGLFSGKRRAPLLSKASDSGTTSAAYLLILEEEVVQYFWFRMFFPTNILIGV